MTIRVRGTWLAASALVALASPAIAQSGSQHGSADQGSPDQRRADQDWSNDIIVTAQKREQSLQEIPQSISVVSGEMLANRQATSLVDYAALVPGLTLQQTSAGESRVILRGINTGSSSPTVAIYVDDTPFGSSTGQTNAAHLAGDVDPFDIARIEVLRGPQGTLYGANSLGGVLKYVTVAPQFDALSVRGQLGIDTVEDGGVGWSANGVVNVPITDSIAIRASGFYRKWPGYIDSIGFAGKDTNSTRSYGGRASLLFKPSDNFSLRLTALAQNIRARSPDLFEADPVALRPIKADPITGAPLSGLNRYRTYSDMAAVDYRLYSGTAQWDLGPVELTSATSYGELFERVNLDPTFLDAGGASLGDAVTYGIYGAAAPLGVVEPERISMKKFTQEVRLSSTGSDVFEWLVGGYYTREPGLIDQRYLPFDLATRKLINPAVSLGGVDFSKLLTARLQSVYSEYAGFGSVTWHLTPRFDITGGVRYSRNRQTADQTLDGALAGGLTQLHGKSSEGVFTWSVAPRFAVNDRVAIYARVAKGYRPGGPNVVPPGAGPDYPFQFKADTLVSYEGGIRAETPDGRFAIDTSIYYLDWKDIQIISTFDTALGPVNADANGKGAQSYGVETSVTLRPTRGLTVIGSIAYNNAELRGDTGTGGFDGDQLPYAPRWSGSFAADYEWAVSDRAKAFLGGSVSLVSDRPADFDQGYQAKFGHRLILDGYQTVDVRGGVDFDLFKITVFAKNATNARGLITANAYGQRAGGNIDVAPIRPRTIGASVDFSF